MVLDVDFERCQLAGFVEATVSLERDFFNKFEEYNDNVRKYTLYTLYDI